MSVNPRFSNAISNIDINSYRAYKNMLKNGNNISPQKNINKRDDNSNSNFTKINNNDIESNMLKTKNLTKYIFSSQSKRFEWQTNEAINRNSELTGSINSLRQKDLNSEKWHGFNNLSQDENSIKNYDKNRKYFIFCNSKIFKLIKPRN